MRDCLRMFHMIYILYTPIMHYFVVKVNFYGRLLRVSEERAQSLYININGDAYNDLLPA